MVERPKAIIETQADREPFLIRGHHIRFYASLCAGTSPHMLSELMREATEKEYETAMKEFLKANDTGNVSNKIMYQLQDSETYKKDVYGQKPEEADQVQEQHKKIFEQFLQIPPDYPIELISEKKDEICNGCIFGEHCQPIEKEDLEDWSNVNIFIRQATELQVPFSIDMTTDSIGYSNPPSRVTIPTVRTTAGALKTVLENTKIRAWRLPKT
jgi:hypothetical protein